MCWRYNNLCYYIIQLEKQLKLGFFLVNFYTRYTPYSNLTVVIKQSRLSATNSLYTWFCQHLSAVSVCWYQDKVPRKLLKLHYFIQFYSNAVSFPHRHSACTQFISLWVPLVASYHQLSKKQAFSGEGPPFLYTPFSCFPLLCYSQYR